MGLFPVRSPLRRMPANVHEARAQYVRHANSVQKVGYAVSCAYCGKPAVHMDHIVSKSMRRRHPGWEDVTVPACFACNMRKGTRRLVPPSWKDRLDELPGTRPWKVWDGKPQGAEVMLR